MSVKRHTMTYGFLAVLGVSTVGCVTHGVVRDTTRTVSGHVERLDRALSEYTKILEADATARVERLAAQRRDVAAAEAKLQALLAAWALAGRDGEVRLYEGVVKAAADAVVAHQKLADLEAREAAALKATQAKFDTQSKDFKSLVQQLNELAETPGVKEQAKFLFGYLSAVGEEVQKLQADAKKAADQAKAVPPSQ